MFENKRDPFTLNERRLQKEARLQKLPNSNRKSLPLILMGALIPLVLTGTIIGALTHRGLGLMNMLMLFFSVLFCGYHIGVRRLPGGIPALILLAYTAWLIVTRIFLGDTGLSESNERIAYVIFASTLCYWGSDVLSFSCARKQLLGVVLLLLIGFCVFIWVGTIMVPLFGIWENEKLSGLIYISESFYRLHFCHMSSSIIGVYDFFGIISTVVIAVWTKNRIIRIVTLFLTLFILTMHSVTDARASSIMIGSGLGISVGLLLYELLRSKKATYKNKHAPALRWTACIMASVIIFLGTIVYLPLASDMLERSCNSYRESQSFIYTRWGESGHERLNISNRGYSLKYLRTLTDRVYVYEEAVDRLIDDPTILIMGELYSGDVINVQSVDGFSGSFSHYHSSIISTLMETGLPGLLLMTAFCLLTVIRAVKVFFNINGVYALHSRISALYITAPIVIGLIEPILFSTPASADMWAIFMLFTFFAGYIHSVPDISCHT